MTNKKNKKKKKKLNFIIRINNDYKNNFGIIIINVGSKK